MTAFWQKMMSSAEGFALLGLALLFNSYLLLFDPHFNTIVTLPSALSLKLFQLRFLR